MTIECKYSSSSACTLLFCVFAPTCVWELVMITTFAYLAVLRSKRAFLWTPCTEPPLLDLLFSAEFSSQDWPRRTSLLVIYVPPSNPMVL